MSNKCQPLWRWRKKSGDHQTVKDWSFWESSLTVIRFNASPSNDCWAPSQPDTLSPSSKPPWLIRHVLVMMAPYNPPCCDAVQFSCTHCVSAALSVCSDPSHVSWRLSTVWGCERGCVCAVIDWHLVQSESSSSLLQVELGQDSVTLKMMNRWRITLWTGAYELKWYGCVLLYWVRF